MPIKVLQIVVSNSKENTQIITGPERRAANLAAHWDQYDIEPIICYPKLGDLKAYFTGAGLKVIPFELKSKFDFNAISTLRKIIKANEIELVHTQGAAALDMMATIAAKLEGVKMVITRPVMISDQVHYASWRRKLYGVIDKNITLKYADQVIAVSKKGFQTLKEEYHVKEEKLRVIYNGVDALSFPAKSDDVSEDSHIIQIGMVAHLSPFKGWGDFLQVIQRIHEKSKIPIKGFIIGKGEMEQELKRLAYSLGLEKVVEFVGYTDNVSQYLKMLDIFLFSSYREGLSVAVIEAMFSALPIVATEVGGIREQVALDKNGYVLPVGDIDALTHSCLKLIKNKALRINMGSYSRQIAMQKFSEKNMLESYVSCYKYLVAE